MTHILPEDNSRRYSPGKRSGICRGCLACRFYPARAYQNTPGIGRFLFPHMYVSKYAFVMPVLSAGTNAS